MAVCYQKEDNSIEFLFMDQYLYFWYDHKLLLLPLLLAEALLASSAELDFSCFFTLDFLGFASSAVSFNFFLSFCSSRWGAAGRNRLQKVMEMQYLNDKMIHDTLNYVILQHDNYAT